MKIARARPLVVIGALLSLLLGCAPDLPELSAEQQWSDALRRLSLFAIYPATEDVLVGDLYLSVPPSDGNEAVPHFSAVRLASVPCRFLIDALTAQQGQRPRIEAYHETTAAAPLAPASAGRTASQTRRKSLAGAASKPIAEGCPKTISPGFDIGDSRNTVATPVVRLHRTDVPSLTVARVSEGQLGGSGTMDGVAFQLGFGSAGSTALTIKLGDLQELTLDTPRATGMIRRAIVEAYRYRLNNPNGDFPVGTGSPLSPRDVLTALQQASVPARSLAKLACQADWTSLANENVRIIVANRVLYAGSIDYQFGKSRQTALKAAVDLAATLPAASRSVKPPALPATMAASSADTDATKRQAQAVKDLLAAVQGGPEGSPLGITASYGVGSEGTLTLTQTYTRPMAVGFGAALTYPLESAMVPLTDDEIIEAENYCRTDGGIEPDPNFNKLRRANMRNVAEQASGQRPTVGSVVFGGSLPSRPLALGRARTF